MNENIPLKNITKVYQIVMMVSSKTNNPSSPDLVILLPYWPTTFLHLPDTVQNIIMPNDVQDVCGNRRMLPGDIGYWKKFVSKLAY
jgi:hypothetical protein